MAGYIGLEAIARRMGWRSPRTVVNRVVSDGFPAYQERRNLAAFESLKPRPTWSITPKP